MLRLLLYRGLAVLGVALCAGCYDFDTSCVSFVQPRNKSLQFSTRKQPYWGTAVPIDNSRQGQTALSPAAFGRTSPVEMLFAEMLSQEVGFDPTGLPPHLGSSTQVSKATRFDINPGPEGPYGGLELVEGSLHVFVGKDAPDATVFVSTAPLMYT